MIIDFQQVTLAGDIITFPDFAYAPLPKQTTEIKDTITLDGSNTGSTISIGGSVEGSES